MVALIAAMSRNRVIGINNSLPWNLPGDLKHFRNVTSGHTVVMGRKTFESIGKPLPKRTNVVVSRSNTGVHRYSDQSEAWFVSSLDDALRGSANSTYFIIGGATLYQEALRRGLVDRIYLTLLHQDFNGDTFFPEIPSDFTTISTEPREENGLKYDFIIMDRGSKHESDGSG